ANAWKNTNRSRWLDGTTVLATYCYDGADRLFGSSDPIYNSLSYNSHGDLDYTGNDQYNFDQADRNLALGAVHSPVPYQPDTTDRIVQRDLYTKSPWTGVPTQTERYASSGDGDTPDLTLDGSGNVIERTMSLPGGVLYTDRGGNDATVDVWGYPNIHGDIAT